METKLLKIIRANFGIEYSHFTKEFIAVGYGTKKIISDNDSFNVVVKMLEQIYPQGHHYAIMRHSRRFKQARRKEAVRMMEVACVVGFVALVVIAILNSCCGTGIQY